MDPEEGRRCLWCETVIYYGQFCSNECADKHYEQYRKLAGPNGHYKGHVPNKRETERNET